VLFLGILAASAICVHKSNMCAFCRSTKSY
jgi:hypothetical protein